MAVTQRKIAKELGLSCALVSRVLRGDRSLQVREETRRRVHDASARLGWVRSVANGPSCHITVPLNRHFAWDWIRDTRHFLLKYLIEGAETALNEGGGRLSFTRFDPAKRLETFQELCAPGAYCDGILLLSGLLDEPLAEQLRASGKPCVCVDFTAERFGISSVVEHAYGGFSAAIAHLLTLGHRRIGHLGPHDSRYSHFIAAKLDHGLPADQDLDCVFEKPVMTSDDPPWRELGYASMAAALAKGLPATALVCHNDLVALGAKDALLAAGLKAGRDLSLVGYDNIEERSDAPVKQPVLTTLEHDPGRIGEHAALLLKRQVENPNLVASVVHERIPVRLLIRTSTAAVADATRSAVARRRKGKTV